MDILGFFDGLFSFFSTVRAGKAVNESDSQRVESASSQTAINKEQAFEQQNKQSIQRRKSHRNETVHQKQLEKKQAEQKSELIKQRNREIQAKRKTRRAYSKSHSLDMEP